MARVPFVKVEGLGNDFVVVDLRPGQPAAPAAKRLTDPGTVKAICDRHFGVGADGVLAILPGETGDVRMRVLNSDGSEAEMCGNGIRCVAKVLYESDPGLRRSPLRIDTGAGPLECAINAADGVVSTVSVDMGKPRLSRAEIPMTGPANESVVRAPFTIRGQELSFTAVSMGNPHAVFFIEDEKSDLLELARQYGPFIETDSLFPKRTNVEFARVLKDRDGGATGIDLVVWERGVGITLACGTGACATAVAAYLEGRARGDREIPINLPGGTLFITVNAIQQNPDSTASLTPRGVVMRGPAHTVFRAELDPETFAGL